MVAKSPLNWPEGYRRTASYARKNAKFRSNGSNSLRMEDAVRRLRDELGRIGVKDFDGDVIISTNLKANLAGMPRADQGEPSDPGVAVYWEVAGQPRRVLPVDIYTTVKDNIAAVAAVLEYMRGIERHGGAMIQERAFSGFDALPPPDDCWKILGIEFKVARAKAPDVAKQYVSDAFRIGAREGAHVSGFDMDRLVKARDAALKELGL